MNTRSSRRTLKHLASDHDFVLDASPPPRRRGLWAFVSSHPSLSAALFTGVSFSLAAILCTYLLSRQLLECPLWALHCDKADEWTVNNLGTVQGVVTFVYLIGLACLSYVVHNLCEAAIWPLLSRDRFTLRQVDEFLTTSRGILVSSPSAFLSIKSSATRFVLACAVAVTLIPFAGAPLVGYAYVLRWKSIQLQGHYQPGGGITELYAQTDPPTSMMVDVLANYASWASNSSSEPLPDLREWYVDRSTLQSRGDFVARAVRFQQAISCGPHQLQQVIRDGLAWNAFTTNMTQSSGGRSGRNSSAEIWVRPSAQLTLWADDFSFVSANRTSATVVFAALNGTIEGGTWTPLYLGNITGASAVACAIDIEAIDDVLKVGKNAPGYTASSPVLSSLETLRIGSASEEGINQLLLWFAMAPQMAGSSVDGTQPMFYNSSSTNLPVPYTSSDPEKNLWTTEGIEAFIRLSIGALSQATSTTGAQDNQQVTLTSVISERKLDSSRAVLLVILPVLLLGITVLLGVWNAWAHHRNKIPVMRLAGVDELLKSSQTQWVAENAGIDAAKTYLPSELGSLKVQYGIDQEGGAGLSRGVKKF
ncbi:hypothetical protein NKR23_g2105 [Pleurostoma richardsiae]|uniref:Uncharacterized protein n=1 Tax=Pleurostoma richardsiae TaxID=41990 RepID=A0AA38RY64_9PEZI|nr:hypothetical protein NKR23_g2105 [Pleurostoma richardsiae]